MKNRKNNHPDIIRVRYADHFVRDDESEEEEEVGRGFMTPYSDNPKGTYIMFKIFINFLFLIYSYIHIV